VKRRGDQVVEFAESRRRAHARGVVEPREALQLGERFGNQRIEEVARVEQPIEPAVERRAGGGEIERRRHRRGAPHHVCRRVAALAEPLQQRITAQRYAGGEKVSI